MRDDPSDCGEPRRRRSVSRLAFYLGKTGPGPDVMLILLLLLLLAGPSPEGARSESRSHTWMKGRRTERYPPAHSLTCSLAPLLPFEMMRATAAATRALRYGYDCATD